jgi:hypothetical protein
MIDLPDVGYNQKSSRLIDAGGVVQGSLGGPDDILDRLGVRYALTITTALLSGDTMWEFQALLEQGSRDFVSYPFPLDFRPLSVGTTAQADGSVPPGAALAMAGLPVGYVIHLGQIVSINDGFGSVHRVTGPVTADATGHAVLPVFPWIRRTIPNATPIEIEKPRIRGTLQWQGPQQGAFAAQSFTFTIQEAR